MAARLLEAPIAWARMESVALRCHKLPAGPRAALGAALGSRVPVRGAGSPPPPPRPQVQQSLDFRSQARNQRHPRRHGRVLVSSDDGLKIH